MIYVSLADARIDGSEKEEKEKLKEKKRLGT
jgi:hypothetical protein